jgi:hypothetical protein
MINKYFTVMGITICLICLFGAVAVHETEETKRALATQELQSKEFENSFREAIDNCYDEYAEVEDKNTVVLVDGLSNIEYSIEDKESKEAILEQFIPLFKEVTRLNLNDKPLTELFDVILRG